MPRCLSWYLKEYGVSQCISLVGSHGVEDVGSLTCSLFQPVHLAVCKVNGKITGYLINAPLQHVYCGLQAD